MNSAAAPEPKLTQAYKASALGNVPEDWRLANISSKGDVLNGKALAVNAPGKQRPYLRTKNVFDGYIDIKDVLTMPMTNAQFEQFKVISGDVLLNEGQSLELVGRCAMYRGEYPEPCAMQNQLLRFRARVGVSAEYATQLFRYCQQTGVFARVALQTTSIAHLGGTRFEKLILPWPETEEQHAIAAALSDVDALIGALDKLIEKKRAIKLATMQRLLTGRVRLPGFAKGATRLGRVAADWNVVPLGSLGRWRGGLTPSMADPKNWAGGDIPWISSSDVRGDEISSTAACITKRAIERTTVPVLPTGSIVVVMRSGILRRFLPVARMTRSMAVNQDIKALSPNPSFDSRFVQQMITFRQADILASCMKSGTTVESIDAAWFKAFTIALPSPNEQAAIADVISEMEDEIRSLEQRRDKMKLIKQGMMQELLTGRTRLI
jgi:type I restriction enzyme, S subunit